MIQQQIDDLNSGFDRVNDGIPSFYGTRQPPNFLDLGWFRSTNLLCLCT